MNTIHRTALALILAGAMSCVAYGSGPYQGPPNAPPDYRGGSGYPDSGYDDYRHSPDVDVGFFYQELSPYGDWVYTHEYGWTWLPRNVRVGWRPYYYGQWAPSDYGWLWVSNEPFGWATYHFGRWALHPRFGWIWVPGRTWGPAWVSWQSGAGYIGWAPLPPEIGFEFGVGLRLGNFNLSVVIQPHAYTFVQERVFLERDPYRWAAPSARNVTIINNTTNITNYTVIEQRVVNRGIDVQRVERATGRRVKPLRVTETASGKQEAVRGDQVLIYRAPKTRLDTVRIDENAAPRRRQPSPASMPGQSEPAAQEDLQRASGDSDLQVAPRVKAAPPMTSEQFERKKQKEQSELEAFQRTERQRLDQIQRQEREKPQPSADAAAISKRHAEETKALEEELNRSKQHLNARLEVERKAAQATAPGKSQAADKKGDQKKGEEKNDNSKGKK